MVIFMNFNNNTQSVNWACWFDVVEMPWAFALSFYPDEIIKTVYIHGFVFAFGNIGEALAIIVLVIQIAGSGGSYPIELLPNFFQQVYLFFPFPYAINAMREAIAGLYQNQYLNNLP